MTEIQIVKFSVNVDVWNKNKEYKIYVTRRTCDGGVLKEKL
jgi:hypothetical protein